MQIAIADPSRTILKAVSRLLESDGHAVFSFTDGAEALGFIQANTHVEVLLTSAELPSISGLKLCWETRLLCRKDRAIYVILMSSTCDPSHLITALDSGADEFIRKPPVAVELYARLRSADRALRFQRELIDLATTDSLTGTLNRRAFFEQAQQRCSHATDQDPLTVIMFDLDYFKRVNDTYGHDVGDQVLRTIGEVGRDHGGIIGRLGGEEFGLLLERSHLQAGIEHAEGLRAAVSELSFATPSGMLLVTCSFGVAQRQSHESVDQVLKRADIALYYAKKNGRNRVVAAEQRRVVTRDLEWSGLLRSLPRPEIGTDRAPDGSAKCRM